MHFKAPHLALFFCARDYASITVSVDENPQKKQHFAQLWNIVSYNKINVDFFLTEKIICDFMNLRVELSF